MYGKWFQDHKVNLLCLLNIIKHGVDGSIEKYKVTFVAKGFYQKEGIYYDEIFALVACYTTIRSIVGLAVNQGWSPHQMDEKTVFLHGFLKEEVFVKQPQGFELHDWKTRM